MTLWFYDFMKGSRPMDLRLPGCPWLLNHPAEGPGRSWRWSAHSPRLLCLYESASLRSLGKKVSKNQLHGVKLCFASRCRGHGLCCKLTPLSSFSTVQCYGSYLSSHEVRDHKVPAVAVWRYGMVLQLWTELYQNFSQNLHPSETLCKSHPCPVCKLSQGQQKRDKQGQSQDGTSIDWCSNCFRSWLCNLWALPISRYICLSSV